MYPILFRIGSFEFGTFGLMAALGFFFGIGYARRSLGKIGIPEERVFDLGLVALVGALVGSRLAYLIVEWDRFMKDPAALIFSREGYVFYGGFLLAVALGVLYCRIKGFPVLKVADGMAPAGALGHVFGRIGCFLNGCCYGGVCRVYSPLFRFPKIVNEEGDIVGSGPYIDHLNQGLIDTSAASSLPVHPTQLYEAAGLLVLFVLLHKFLQRENRTPGMVFLAYAVGYSVLRFINEFFRADDRGWLIQGALSTSQAVALGILLLAPVAWKYLKSQPQGEQS